MHTEADPYTRRVSRVRGRDHSFRRRSVGATGLVWLLLTGSLAGCGLFDRHAPAPSPSLTGVGATISARDREALSRQVVNAQARAVARGDRSGFVSGWDTALRSSRRRAHDTYANLTALRVVDWSARYLASDSGSQSVRRPDNLAGAVWTAQVTVSWRLDGFDSADAESLLAYTLVQRGEQARIVDIRGAANAREPVWSTGPLEVRRSAHTLVAAATDHDADRLDRLLQVAYRDVHRVLEGWHGRLVAYSPASAEQFESALDATPGSVATVAAITTAVDGSQDSRAPVAIVVQPDVFDAIGALGRQNVITHEATHVATDAAVAVTPLWLVEGFADYVAIRSLAVPPAQWARQLIRQVRRGGAPKTLPGDAAFALTRSDVEVSYEQAHVAVQLINSRYGRQRLLAFYDAVSAHPSLLDHALRAELGTTPHAFTSAWRHTLQKLAGVE